MRRVSGQTRPFGPGDKDAKINNGNSRLTSIFLENAAGVCAVVRARVSVVVDASLGPVSHHALSKLALAYSPATPLQIVGAPTMN